MRVIVADDSVLFREGLVLLLGRAGMEVVGQAADAGELHAVAARERPDVAIIDIRMPPGFSTEGLVAARDLRASRQDIGVLILSQYVETRHVIRLLGDAPEGLGYLLKDRVSDISQLAEAVRRVAAGGTVIEPELVAQLLGRSRKRGPLDELTTREREVLALMAEGLSNQAICQRLVLSPKTIEAHVRGVLGKLALEAGPDHHRRVLAVLTYLRST
jgi:DNA-binding NarL/FixJ family response regulator